MSGWSGGQARWVALLPLCGAIIAGGTVSIVRDTSFLTAGLVALLVLLLSIPGLWLLRAQDDREQPGGGRRPGAPGSAVVLGGALLVLLEMAAALVAWAGGSDATARGLIAVALVTMASVLVLRRVLHS